MVFAVHVLDVVLCIAPKDMGAGIDAAPLESARRKLVGPVTPQGFKVLAVLKAEVVPGAGYALGTLASVNTRVTCLVKTWAEGDPVVGVVDSAVGGLTVLNLPGATGVLSPHCLPVGYDAVDDAGFPMASDGSVDPLNAGRVLLAHVMKVTNQNSAMSMILKCEPPAFAALR
jgi:hypothetical protein